MRTYQDCSVYMHINKHNGKVYIGMTSRPVNTRWKNGKGYSTLKFGRAINKYGWDGFEHVVVKSGLSLEEAYDLEKELIKEFDSTDPSKGYNEAIGGKSGGMHKKHHSEEAKQKISEARKRDGFSDLHKKHISEAKQGVKHHFAKPVYQYNLEGELIKFWEYTSLATKQLGICKSSIGEVCSGKRKTAGGYIWSHEKR